jgi:hypothetical protein
VLKSSGVFLGAKLPVLLMSRDKIMQLQTSDEDIRAGWKYFTVWKKRFERSTSSSHLRNSNDYIYLANWMEIQCIDDLFDFPNIEDACKQKIAFMQAYLVMVALESHNFETDVKALLKLQSRINAPRSFGVWFAQSDIGQFGGGMSPYFQGDEISIFCEKPKQIDYSDISTILPYDRVIVRNPTGKWTQKKAQKLVDHVKWDLAFDGDETEIDFDLSWDLLRMELLSPDYGLGARNRQSTHRKARGRKTKRSGIHRRKK